MGLLDRFKQAWSVLRRGSPNMPTTDSGTNLRRTDRGYFAWMQQRDDRQDVEEIIERMDEEDEIVSSALDAIADCATVFPDTDSDKDIIVESEDVRTQEVLEGMFLRTGLYGNTWDILRTMVEKGNHFCQNVVGGEDGQIVAVKQFPYSYQIQKNVDHSGELLDGDPVAAIRDDERGRAAYDQIINNSLVAAFYPFQILHFRYGVTKGKTYAKPILQSAVRNWQRLQAAEDSVAVARIIRAYNHLVHHIPCPIEATPEEQLQYIKRYKEMMTEVDVADWDSTNSYTDWDKTPSPATVATDLFLFRFYTMQGDVIEGDVGSVGGENPHITNLEDLDRSLNRILCVLKVPSKYLNYDTGQRHFVDTGDKERDEQFGRVLRKIQKAYKAQMYTLCDIELALAGIDPTSTDYSLLMSPIAVRAREREINMENQRGQTATFWRAADVPATVVWDKVLGLNAEDIERAQEYQDNMGGDNDEDEESGEGSTSRTE